MTVMKTLKTRCLTLCTVLVIALGGSACTNPETPEGYEGYVHYIPLIFGKMEFRRAITGPASTGLSWRLFVANIDMRTRNFKEPFKLLTRDNLSVEFEVNTRIKLRPGSVQEVVEQWGGENWYEWNVKEQLRTIVRRRVMQQSASDIQLKSDVVRQFVQQDLEAKFSKTPVHIDTVDIGQIDFPEEVVEAIRNRESKKQELERQRFILAKAHKEAAIVVLKALKVAKEQQIISSTLDPLYVQRRAVEVYRSLAKSENKTVILLPNTTEGTGMPLVMTKGQRKILTSDGRALLDKMEAKYMKIAKSAAVDDPILPKDDVPAAPAPKETPKEAETTAPTPKDGKPASGKEDNAPAPSKPPVPSPAPAVP